MNEEVSFPQDVTYISEYEFSNNSVIRTVFIHKNIKIIGKKAVKNCKELKKKSWTSISAAKATEFCQLSYKILRLVTRNRL